ncbi:hypothetical protein ACFQQB_45500 [Nonomuraea rubra]|uniref:hypothetical protein n=1 Tax=Nonomuraea rubra TaxID=46180 RepID=UPI00361A3E7B
MVPFIVMAGLSRRALSFLSAARTTPQTGHRQDGRPSTPTFMAPVKRYPLVTTTARRHDATFVPVTL